MLWLLEAGWSRGRPLVASAGGSFTLLSDAWESSWRYYYGEISVRLFVFVYSVV